MKKMLVLMLALSLFAVSCGKKEVKRVTEDSKIATEVFGVAETIRNAYMKKDMATIEKNTTREGFRAISGVMKSFDSAELTFNPVWVEIESDLIYLNIAWKGTWRKGGKATDERGMAVFVLQGKPFKVDNILRENPFKYPD